jgi:hypothetical protein
MYKNRSYPWIGKVESGLVRKQRSRRGKINNRIYDVVVAPIIVCSNKNYRYQKDLVSMHFS